mmetsp:Transcript_23322/g.65055  ORF Transcript_23322/g.65055 Transcript_23322/m.65055 type:complete len:118 (-) Transcript_23322:814-1167(-)
MTQPTEHTDDVECFRQTLVGSSSCDCLEYWHIQEHCHSFINRTIFITNPIQGSHLQQRHLGSHLSSDHREASSAPHSAAHSSYEQHAYSRRPNICVAAINMVSRIYLQGFNWRRSLR